MRYTPINTKFVTPEQIDEASKVDLLTYLETCEPDNLVKITDGIYCTREHDSLKISNGKWMWWSQGFGGFTALQYLMKVEEKSLPEAVSLILGDANLNRHTMKKMAEPLQPKVLNLPKAADNNKRLYAYLIKERGIDPEIVKYFVNHNFIYESLQHHNAVFIGYDNDNMPKYACWRGLNRKRFMGDCSGSSKEYSFRYIGDKDNTTIHIFECAIDLLSYATLLKDMDVDWTKFNLISLAGVYQSKKNIANSKLPIAIQMYLDEHKYTSNIYLHLDNDKAGRGATTIFKTKLGSVYKVIDNPVPLGKDVNDFLLIQKGIIKPFKYKERSVEYAR